MDRIFIVGYVHSGTTLLQKILSKNDDVFTPHGETHFFDLKGTYIKPYKYLDKAQARTQYIKFIINVIENGYYGVIKKKTKYTNIAENEEFVEQLISKTEGLLHEEIYVKILDEIAKIQNKKCWVERTPAHIFHIDEINRLISDAKFLIIIRDPRDILASKKMRVKKGYMFNPIFDSLAWKSAVINTMANTISQHNKKVIKYEELVSYPAECIKSICKFMNINFSPQMLNVGWVNNTTVISKKSKKIGKDAIGKYQKILINEEIFFIQHILKKYMEKYTYTPFNVSELNKRELMRIVVNSFCKLNDKIKVHLNSGGKIYLYNKIKDYGKRSWIISKNLLN